MITAKSGDRERSPRVGSWPLRAVSYATLASLLTAGCERPNAESAPRALEFAAPALETAGAQPGPTASRPPDAGPSPVPAPVPGKPVSAPSRPADPPVGEFPAPPPLEPEPADAPSQASPSEAQIALAELYAPSLPNDDARLPEDQGNGGPGADALNSRGPLLIVAVEASEPIALPAPIKLEGGPLMLAEANPGPSVEGVAEAEPAPTGQRTLAALRSPRPAAPALPRVDGAQAAGDDAEAPERIVEVANAASSLRDERAYVPQISTSDRQAYVAQLDFENPQHRLAVRIDGQIVGGVQFQVSDGHIAVHVGQVLDLFRSRIEPARFAALRNSQAAGEFVSLETIRSAGIAFEYDAAYDELVLGRGTG